MNFNRFSLFLPTLLSLAACSSPEPAPPINTSPNLPSADIPEGCNPIAYKNDCMLPYPSDFFLVDDPSTPTQKRVSLTPAAELKSTKGLVVNFMNIYPADGFSRNAAVMAVFPEGVDTSNVVFHTDDPALSLKPENTTIVLDAETGEPVAHWAELDKNTDIAPRQAFFIRPFAPFKEKHRYIVALSGLVGRDGKLIEPPLGFAHLLQKQTAGNATLEPLSAHYEQAIFPALETFGMKRDSLQLAWDFTTGSDELRTRDMLAIRKDALAKMASKPPAATITNTIDNPSMEIALRIEGTIKVPLYLESAAPGAMLFRNAAGEVVQNGEADVPFLVQVPVSAMPADANFTPARILQFGHGFFGLGEEINYGFMRGFSNEQRYITAAVDTWGMSEPDLPVLIDTLINGDPSTLFSFTDRVHQAMVNNFALSIAIKGVLANLMELKRFDKLLYDPSQLYFYGISQGGILGVTLVALSPDLDRAAFSVGGGSYSLMMTRSASYTDLFTLIQGVLNTPLDVQKFAMLSQTAWDRVESMGYAEHLLANPYPSSPAKRHVLMQMGIGDHSVNNLASHFLARAVGIPLLDPSPRAVFGLEAKAAPMESGLSAVDFKLANPEPGIECRLPSEAEKNDVHEGVRRNVKMKAQLDAFFQPNGMVEQFCDGVCDPE